MASEKSFKNEAPPEYVYSHDDASSISFVSQTEDVVLDPNGNNQFNYIEDSPSENLPAFVYGSLSEKDDMNFDAPKIIKKKTPSKSNSLRSVL